jgi:hypothetical protein
MAAGEPAEGEAALDLGKRLLTADKLSQGAEREGEGGRAGEPEERREGAGSAHRVGP